MIATRCRRSEGLPVSEYGVVVGGGPAGLSAAPYSTRLGHATALVDRGGGRAAMMQGVHNVDGVTEDRSGAEPVGVGKEQLEDHGWDLRRDVLSSCDRGADGPWPSLLPAP